jgi:FtsZ-binding cell division protein ZapB
MSKMTVADAAEHFNISKEAIHNRIRRGTLNSVIENGVKYVMLPDAKPAQQADSRFHDYIEKENERLKEKNEKLEAEIDRLRDQREQMLIAEREKIEQIYKERDEQLKSVLQVFASKLLPESTVEAIVEEAVAAEAEVVEEPAAPLPEEDFEDGIIDEEEAVGSIADKPDPFEGDEFNDLVSLKNFMKLKGYGKKQRQRIKERFKTNAEDDSRILVRGGKLHLRPYHYDYSDLLE